MAHDMIKATKQDIAAVAPPTTTTPTFLANSMDGPSLKWTVADVTKVNNRLFMTYHVMGSGYDYLTPLGCLIGAFALPKTTTFKTLTRLQAAGTGGLIGGGTGMVLGTLLMTQIAYSKNPKIPWDEEGIQMRVDGLSHNYRVRVMDLGVWMGIAAAGVGLAVSGGPTKLKLLPGTHGALQALALGSAAGSIGAVCYIKATI